MKKTIAEQRQKKMRVDAKKNLKKVAGAVAKDPLATTEEAVGVFEYKEC